MTGADYADTRVRQPSPAQARRYWAAMSQANREIAQRAIAAFNGRDEDAFAACTTPDFEWSPSMSAIEGDFFRGREGIAQYFASLGNAWERFQIVTEEFRELPDVVVMLGRLEGLGKGSGVPVDSPLGMVFDFRDGSISRIRGYLDRDEALRAVGVQQGG